MGWTAAYTVAEIEEGLGEDGEEEEGRGNSMYFRNNFSFSVHPS